MPTYRHTPATVAVAAAAAGYTTHAAALNAATTPDAADTALRNIVDTAGRNGNNTVLFAALAVLADPRLFAVYYDTLTFRTRTVTSPRQSSRVINLSRPTANPTGAAVTR